MALSNDIAGQAALTICESLLLSLCERKILPEKEIIGILKDAAAAHEFVPVDEQADRHAAVASMINILLDRLDATHRR
jgi:hypothetical protein